MNRRQSNLRIAIVSAFTLASIAVALTLIDRPQNAQKQPDGPKRTARYTEFATADAITAEIRSTGRRLIRIDTPTRRDRDTAAEIGTIVGDYGAFVVVSQGASKRLTKGTEILKTALSLPGASFDPIEVPPAGTIGAESSPSDGYYVVQFGTIANAQLLDSLRDAGVEILQYVPNQAFLVYGSGGAIAKATAHSRVRWVGAFRPEHKIAPELRTRIVAAKNGRRLPRGVAPIDIVGGSSARFSICQELGASSLSVRRSG